MKKSLLTTVAAVALIAGAGFASAAENARDHGGGAAVRSEPEMKKGADVKAAAPTKGRAETTGAGVESQSEMKAEPKAPAKADSKAARPSTTGAGPAETNSRTEMKSGSDTRAGSDKSRSQDVDSKAASDNKAGTTKAGADSKTNAAAADSKSGAGASVSLTSDQKTKIRTSVIQSGNAPKLSRSSINFNISVGTTVPRSVHFVSVPSTLIEIHPAWRGYEYFVVDEEIIIIDPRTLRIVAILDV